MRENRSVRHGSQFRLLFAERLDAPMDAHILAEGNCAMVGSRSRNRRDVQGKPVIFENGEIKSSDTENIFQYDRCIVLVLISQEERIVVPAYIVDLFEDRPIRFQKTSDGVQQVLNVSYVHHGMRRGNDVEDPFDLIYI